MSRDDAPDPAREPGIDRANEDRAGIDRAGIEELVGLVEDLDADNERLRLKVLEILRLMEDAVTAQVAAERRAADLAAERDRLAAELDAVRATRIMRWSRPVRDLYGRLRGRS